MGYEVSNFVFWLTLSNIYHEIYSQTMKADRQQCRLNVTLCHVLRKITTVKKRTQWNFLVSLEYLSVVKQTKCLAVKTIYWAF